MSQLGRISGPLLKANLLRRGVDLAFETDLLYLDVKNLRVGIKTTAPTHDLQVVGTTRTTNLDVTDIFDIGNLRITNNTISTIEGDLSLFPNSDIVVIKDKLVLDNLQIEDNKISGTVSDEDIIFETTGTGIVDIRADTEVEGNVRVSGDLTVEGNFIYNADETNTITFNSTINSDVIPNINDFYTLGSNPSLGGKRWLDIWTENIFTSSVSTSTIVVDGVDITLRQGKIFYVAKNGNNNLSGTHQNDPFATVKYALSQATNGDTVYIYPGMYEEEFPLTVPQGVTVKGTGIRSVLIYPTAATRSNNGFLVNGETTIEDITVADFEYDSVNNTGYAFAFAPNFNVTARSPYIRNITVLTKGSSVRLNTNSLNDPLGFDAGDAGRGAYIDGSVALSTSKEASLLFHSVTFICPNADIIVCTNGVRVEWLNSFTYFANRGMYLISGDTGFAGIGKTRVKITNITGTWSAGNTVTYYDTDGITELASGLIESVENDFYIIDGKALGFETLKDRPGKTASVFGNAQLTTEERKFGLASLRLDGIGSYISYSSQLDFAYGTNDFTIEFWLYRVGSGSQFLIEQRTSALAQIVPYLFLNASNQIQYNSNAVNRISGGVIPQNQWVHIALSRSGTDTKLFINGIQTGATFIDTLDYIQSPLRIGARWDGAQPLNAYIDELRITKGLARYTENFAPPTAAFTSDSSTVLLLHFNGADGSTVIIDDGVTTQDLRTSAGGTASTIDFVDYSDFGAEVRSIGSAAVYGNFGIYGDGDGVIAYLIGQNLAYIGNGKSSTNDPTTVIQANEIVKLNRAKIYFSSVDHQGDFRIGDLFYVNQRTGNVEFSNAEVDFTGGITFTDEFGNVTIINPQKVETGNIRISGNTVESLVDEINFTAANDNINLQSNVNISGNLEVTGNVTIGGNIRLGDEITDTIEVIAKIDSDLVPNVSDTYNLGSPTKRWNRFHTVRITTDAIDIYQNVITTTESNADLELAASGTGRIYIPSNDFVVDQNLTVNTDTNLKDTNIEGTVTHTGDLQQTGNITQTGDITLTGTLTVTSDLQFEDIKIFQNVITTTIGNNNLTLEAAGTGLIYVPNNDVLFDQTLTIVGNTNTSNIINSGTVISNEFTTGDISIDDNEIVTTLPNSNLELRANGTGFIVLEQFDVDENEIRTDNDIILTPNGTGIVSIDSTQSIKIPVGDNSQQPLVPQAGMVRFNTSTNDYEGYDGTYWLPLNGIKDLDRDTFITAELTPGANDNTIRFYAENQLIADLTADRLRVISADIDELRIDDNIISTVDSNTDIRFEPNGTGSLVIGNFSIRSNTITNTVINSITEFNQVGGAYFKIAGTGGVVIPSGSNIERPGILDVGLMRFNTTDGRVEVYNGQQWVSAAGETAGITLVDAEDLSIRNALVFG